MIDSLDPQVVTAADFLGEVFQKGHKEVELRKYLKYRRHLTDAQVDQAFKLFDSRVENLETQKADRPEVEKPQSTSLAKWSFLLPANRILGEKFVKEFFLAEYKYLNVLDCLVEEYWSYLCEMSDRGKISISRKELEPIFHRVIHLNKFHKNFYDDIRQMKSSFGYLFVQN